MKKWWLNGIKYLLLLSFIVPLLTACTVTDMVKEQYPLESVTGSGNETSYVYRADDRSVTEVAAELREQNKPEQQSEENEERMFLVYSKELIHLEKAADDPADTLIEISSKEYVRNNYSSSFLQGYLAASLLGDLFGRVGTGGNYRGYSSKDVYKSEGTYRTPTAADKKIAPPVTVNRTGSIFKRSGSTDSSIGSNDSSTSSTSSNKGIIKRNEKQKESKIYSKPRKTAPKVKMGRSRITRRR